VLGVYVVDGNVIGLLKVIPPPNVVTVPVPPILIGFAVPPDPVPMLIAPPNPEISLTPVPMFNVPVVCVVQIPTSVVFAAAFNDGETTEVPVITPADEIDPVLAPFLKSGAINTVPAVSVVPDDIAPVVAAIFPEVAVIPVPAVIVVLADTDPADAEIFPVVAVIPPDPDVIDDVVLIVPTLEIFPPPNVNDAPSILPRLVIAEKSPVDVI